VRRSAAKRRARSARQCSETCEEARQGGTRNSEKSSEKYYCSIVCDVLEATYLGDVLGDVLGEVLGDDRRAWYFERCSAEEKYMYCMVGTVLLSCCTRTYLCTQYPTVLLYLWPTTCVR
jgi:hypothetical protein